MNDFVIQNQTDYDEFVVHLKSVSKNETLEDKKRHIAILNTKQDVIAISMANIRKIAKKIFKAGYDKFLEIGLKRDYKTEFYEETLVQGLVIAEIKDIEKQAKLIETWVEKIDNWSTCDSTVSTMKTLKNNSDKAKVFEFYLNMCFSRAEFISRFGIVCLMVNFLEAPFIDMILDMCKQVKHDGYYVKMAIAWLLSMSFVKFREKTLAVLETKTLDKFVQNKTISKCRDSFQVSKADKDMLAGLRIK